MGTTCLVGATATELTTLIRDKKASAVEVVQAHLDHIERHNEALNAIVTLDGERALASAKEADETLAKDGPTGLLHGVPITVKDSFETKDLRTTAGFPPLSDHVPQRDAAAVQHARNAGAIILGKTNMPPLAMGTQSDNPIFGRSNNPYDHDYTPGGSTGGGAAAVAANLTPLEIGSDYGGSLRVPAHFCGVFGLKPTEHLVSVAGHIPEPPGMLRAVRHMAAAGPMARSATDLALALRAIAGPDERQPDVTPFRLDPAAECSLDGLRIVWTEDFAGFPICPETKAVLEQVAKAFEGAGCRVERVELPFDTDTVLETFGRLCGAETTVGLPWHLRLLRSLPAKLTPRFLYPPAPILRGLFSGARLDLRDYMETLAQRDELIATTESFLTDVDIWLCPTFGRSAHKHCSPRAKLEIGSERVPQGVMGAGHTILFSLLGQPAVTVPVRLSEAGLPIGVQLVARRYQDMTLLAQSAKLAEVLDSPPTPPSYAPET